MINNDILRIELDRYDGHWVATIFCIEDPVNHAPRVHQLKISNTCTGNLEPLSVMYELGLIINLDARKTLNFVQWQEGPDDPIFIDRVQRQQGQIFWRCEEYL